MLGLGNAFNPDKDIPDLSGKVYVVTGGSSGIGFGICAHLLQHNCRALYLLGKKAEHIAEAEEKLKEYGDVSRVHSIQVELEDLSQTHKVARKLASELETLDGLICNAGIGVGKYSLSKDGIDAHMQINHIAQFDIAMTLLPLLQKTPNSRLVVQSSEFHRIHSISDLQFASVQELNKDIGPSNLYARTKLAQVLFIQALIRRKQRGELGFDRNPDAGPWLLASHPGAVSTDQPEQAVDAYGILGKIGVTAIRPFMKDPESQGCRPALFAATSSQIVTDQLQGAYIVPDCKVSEISKEAKDEQLQENLWNLTVEILASKIGSLGYQT